MNQPDFRRYFRCVFKDHFHTDYIEPEIYIFIIFLPWLALDLKAAAVARLTNSRLFLTIAAAHSSPTSTWTFLSQKRCTIGWIKKFQGL